MDTVSQEPSESRSEDQSQQEQSAYGEQISLSRQVKSFLFWPTLLLATALYSLVALSPRWVLHYRLEQEFSQRQFELASLEKEASRLNVLKGALTNDERFRRAFAESELGFQKTKFASQERVLLGESLQFHGLTDKETTAMAAIPMPFYIPLLEVWGSETLLRFWTAVLSALLLIFAFAVLHEGPVPSLLVMMAALLVRVGRRYLPHSPDEESLQDDESSE